MNATLIWATPNADALIAEMARVSNPANQGNDATAPRLIAYLIRHKHWSPFEMVNACIEINTTRDIGRQILRHRSLTFQEFSQRYADPVALPEVPYREARLRHPSNRQASVAANDPELEAWWHHAQRAVARQSRAYYDAALHMGLAKEVARALLPEGLTPTRLYANGTLRSWLHFVEARIEDGAQPEVAAIATEIRDVLSGVCPTVITAWEIEQ